MEYTIFAIVEAKNVVFKSVVTRDWIFDFFQIDSFSFISLLIFTILFFLLDCFFLSSFKKCFARMVQECNVNNFLNGDLIRLPLRCGVWASESVRMEFIVEIIAMYLHMHELRCGAAEKKLTFGFFKKNHFLSYVYELAHQHFANEHLVRRRRKT